MITYTPFISEKRNDFPEMTPRGYKKHYTSHEIEDDSEEVGYKRTYISDNSKNTYMNMALPYNVPKGYENKYNIFKDAYNKSGVSEERFKFFATLAEKESGFNQRIQNSAGYPAWGYFQFMDGTYTEPDGRIRSWSNIHDIAGVDVDTFINDPILQIQSANKLADQYLKSFNEKDFEVAQEMGYTDSALIAGAWLAGAGGVKKFLHKNQNASDTHGTNVKQRMDMFNGYFKNGGVLKFEKGGKEYLENTREHYNKQVGLNSLLPVGNIPYNLVKSKLNNIRILQTAPLLLQDNWDDYHAALNKFTNTIHINENSPYKDIAKNHEVGHIISQPLIKNIDNLIKKWDGKIFVDDSKKLDSYRDSAKEIGARMYAYLQDSGYNGNRSSQDTLRFVGDERDRFTSEYRSDIINSNTRTRSIHDKNNNITFINRGDNIQGLESKVYRKYDDPYDIFSRYNDSFIYDLIKLFYATNDPVQKGQFGMKLLEKGNQNSGWRLSKDWHAPLLPIYVNSKPDAPDSVDGFKNAKEVYEYILSLPGSNPAIAAGWTGVFMKESGLNHKAVNKSSGASGIAQLLGTRRTEYKKWLKGKTDNWQNQISWVWEKINNGIDDWQVYYDALKDKVDRGMKLSEEEASHWNSMKNSKYRNYSFQNYRDKISNMYDPGDIVELMTWTFERPGNKEAHIDQRRGYANAVYNQFN